ncbi:hypothetical protein MPSEU_000513000 [Mayamaea pseudoterrestris]|nr:hypothetical protein MPSEU_000513000 [Mayamaea pseudoterrestris]
METPSPKIHARPAVSSRRRRRAIQEQQFASYLTFGRNITVCLILFVFIYALVLLVIFPLLKQEAPHEQHIQRGAILKPVLKRAVEKVKQLPHTPGQLVAEGRHSEHLTDKHLMEAADQEMLRLRTNKHEDMQQNKVDGGGVGAPVKLGERAGFMVLGMHRSGTSMLAGLMATGMGYITGGPLIGGAFDNVKGFFERLDVVYQNDEFMNKQSVWWNLNIVDYDTEKALQMKKDGTIDFTNGKKALKFYNDPHNSPWLQKDPRQCLTLKTWLPLMNNEPAIVFTYRHPLEVAKSLKTREEMPISRGLRLWILYNKAALDNSRGLCIVHSSNEAILAEPLDEIKRISRELTDQCHVPKPPHDLTQDDVDRFVDRALQHNKADENAGRAVLEKYDGNCDIYDYESDAKGTDKTLERDLYTKAMRIFCDLKTGKAQNNSYEWPQL